jgi:type II restriction/modification system DNA methylase subunit YeeA
MTPEQFVATYRAIQVNERSAAQSHFMDLCRMLDLPTPVQADPSGESYRFEKPVAKVAGGKGFADVWYAGHFGWEYKGKGADLKRAYEQLLAYREDLSNPPLLIVCDLQNIEVHSNFTGTLKVREVFTLDDLLREDHRLRLRQVWTAPEIFNPTARADEVTRAAVDDLLRIGDALKARGEVPDEVAHFLVKCVFTLFAEDVGLLPRKTFAQLLEAAADRPADFKPMCEQLFTLMKGGGLSVVGRVPHINGGVFSSPVAPDLALLDIKTLQGAARRDWRALEPSIFGTLFERVIDVTKRSELGAHYTPLVDILDVVEPVMLAPLKGEWEALRAELSPIIGEVEQERKASHGKGGGAGLFGEGTLWQPKLDEAAGRLKGFQKRLAGVTVLDPACGSGNFLYTALRLLLDLEAEVRATLRNLTGQAQPVTVSPRQMLGIERSEYAHEIAGMVLWIGYLQWLNEHGENIKDRSPVLDALPGLENRDAVLNGSEAAQWPAAEFIVGNPPFLGYSPMRAELGSEYTDTLRAAYKDRVPGFADLVAYWFELARAQIESGQTRRAGLISTNSIRGGKNRVVLERIAQTGGIFRAWPDRAWTQDGAAVRVSIVCFDDGSETARVLLKHNGPGEDTAKRQDVEQAVAHINPDLTADSDLTGAQRLTENMARAFIGISPGGKFDLPRELAREWLALPNPSGVSNTDVLKPYIGGDDLTDRDKGRWTVDFNQMTLEQAERYRRPMQYVREGVKPVREKNNRALYREKWWVYQETRPGLRVAITNIPRFIGTSRVAKHRVFTWLSAPSIPSDRIVIIADDTDLRFGVVNSLLHTIWAERLGGHHGVGNDLTYNPSTTFETYPFPRPSATQEQAVSEAARFLEQARAFLKTKRAPSKKANASSNDADKTLTLTGMYNLLSEYRATGTEQVAGVSTLADAHDTLDAAVAAAYGWDWPLSEDEVLTRLLALNLERAAAQGE